MSKISQKIYISQEEIANLRQVFGNDTPDAIKTHHQRYYYVIKDLQMLSIDDQEKVRRCLKPLTPPEVDTVVREGGSEVGLTATLRNSGLQTPQDHGVRSSCDEREPQVGSIVPLTPTVPVDDLDAATQRVAVASVKASSSNVMEDFMSSQVIVTGDGASPHFPHSESLVANEASSGRVMARSQETPNKVNKRDRDEPLPLGKDQFTNATTTQINQPATGTFLRHSLAKESENSTRVLPHEPVDRTPEPKKQAHSGNALRTITPKDDRDHKTLGSLEPPVASLPNSPTKPDKAAGLPESGPRARAHVTGETPSPFVPDVPQASARWHGIHATVVGASHLKQVPPVPCQDAALSACGNRPILCAADGAGSSILSHIGSEAVVQHTMQLVESLEPLLHEVLDREEPPSDDTVSRFKSVILRHAIGTLNGLSRKYHHALEAFRCTLLLGILGEQRLLWLKVGDGGLVTERAGKLTALGAAGKGEFANQTTFLGERLSLDDCCYGVVPMVGLSGLAVFTDGAGEKLISNNGSQIAGQLSRFLAEMRAGTFGTHRLFDFLADPEVWRRGTGDDRGMALISRIGA